MATQPQTNQSSVNPAVIAACFLLTFILVSALWSRFHTEIATAYSMVRRVQFLPFVYMGSMWVAIAGAVLVMAGIGVFSAKKSHAKYGLIAVIIGGSCLVGWLMSSIFSSWHTFFTQSDMSRIEVAHIMKSSKYVNLFTFVVGVLPLAIWIANKSLKTNPTNHKHFAKGKDYSLHTFTDSMAALWPHLDLFRKVDLTAESINSGKYRMGDTEKQFAIKHEVMVRVKGNTFKVDSDKAREVFRAQMSSMWTGFNSLTRWERAVIASLLPRVAATDTAMSQQAYDAALDTTTSLLAGYWKDAAASYTKKEDRISIDLNAANEAIRKYGASPKVQRIIKGHAYVHTVIYALLLEARTLGVLPPSEYRWLRIVDRRLWLLVDNVGKMVAFTEVAASYSHFIYEARMKRAIEKPMIEGAVKALIEGVDSYHFSEDEIEEINKRIKSKEDMDLIEAEAIKKNAQNLFLMLLTIGEGAQRDLFEVALVDDKGAVVYKQRCNPAIAIDIHVRERYKLTDDEISDLTKLPTSVDVKAKLLELCNGNNVYCFDVIEFGLVEGLERSAAQLGDCKADSEFDLPATAVMEELITEDEVKPVTDAAMGADLCRRLWVHRQKQALAAQAGRKGA